MILLRLALALLLLPLLLLAGLLGFGRRRDTVHLPEDHPEMAEAVAKARSTLPEFRRLLAEPGPGMSEFAVKARFPTSGGSTEHIWVGELESRGAGFVGKLANVPNDLHGLALGSVVDVTEEMITDWAYAKDGVYAGHHTTRVLLPHMSKKIRAKVEEAYGWTKPVTA
ncbi:MAG TPA: DUF2314 domain-containing protein [Opitutaceae bacterium]|nr:DUF2314 domain-containing protein [Opitutaceae bacterium]